MSAPRHEEEVDRNREVWQRKPLLRDVYSAMYARIREAMNAGGPSVEIGSGIGALRDRAGGVRMTDSFVRPWLDAALDAYALPFRAGALANIIAFDVLHHLARPMAFLSEARRTLQEGGRVILVEPYISAIGRIVYGAFHDEPIAMRAPIDLSTEPPASGYHAAQGNATRLFFSGQWRAGDWHLVQATPFAAFAYVCSGGFSRPAFYPRPMRRAIDRADALLSRWPSLFATRCIVVLQRS
jgi:SAM-dependent methyltransferase